MTKTLSAIVMALLLSGCVKTKLVPYPYMPEPPQILMKSPKDLNTIKPEQKSEPK